ncbi:MAG TPA: cyclic nucleotide-binding domain-containing protein [Ignavibacteriaceae bacterium]|nr:cyclic nucleotide-binding domain-containing protein [Ignavibacteriaceae bacterium]
MKKYYNPKNFYIAKDGEIIYTNGEESTFLYLIIQGEIRIKVSGKKELINRYLYDFFGEMEILQANKRKSCAVAMTETILYKIDFELLHELCLAFIRINRNLKNRYEIEDNLQSDLKINESTLAISTEEESPENELLIPDEIFNDELSAELSEDELDAILAKQKTQQEFKNVMKRVGKIENNEELTKQILGDLSDSDEICIAGD